MVMINTGLNGETGVNPVRARRRKALVHPIGCRMPLT